MPYNNHTPKLTSSMTLKQANQAVAADYLCNVSIWQMVTLKSSLDTSDLNAASTSTASYPYYKAHTSKNIENLIHL